MWNLSFSIIFPVKSSYLGLTCPQTSSDRAGHRWGWTVWLRLTQASGSLIHSLASADTSTFRRSLLFCESPDKAAPGAQHLHQLLSQHPPAGGPAVENNVANQPFPGFSTTLILTVKPQPSLLPLITWAPQRRPCLPGSSSPWISGWLTIIDMKLKDYLVTLAGFCFVCLQASITACVK